MVLIELFSGIGGFALGLQRAGFKFADHYFSEVDNHAIANYKYNFPNAKSLGSITDVRGQRHDAPTIVTFGSPCQDFSLAGKRKGMEGERSSLIMEAIRFVTETQPIIFIWENVKGTFSSNDGADFWAIISAFTNIRGYRLEWQLLNTSWFLPQNRERIYLVGHLTGESEPRVFPITEDGGLLSKTSETGQRQSQTSICATTLTDKCGNRADSTFVSVPKKAGALTAGGHSGGLHSDMTTIEVGTWRTHNDAHGFRGIKNNISPTIPARAREDGRGCPVIKVQPVLTINRAEKRQNGRRIKDDKEVAFTCNCQDQHGIMINESNIRRLTEIETERLQGFPDDWTKFGNYDGVIKEIAKTQRYKLTGNAVTVDVVEEIGMRLLTKNI